LLEVLLCGRPVLYLNQGGHSELVGHRGLPFENTEDVVPQLDRLAASLKAFRDCIRSTRSRQYIELAWLLVADPP
jgi:hypothetical protein